MTPSSTDPPLPSRAARRWALAAAIACALAAGTLDYGSRLIDSASGPRLAQCASNDQECIGHQFLVSHAVVIDSSPDDRRVSVRHPGGILDLSPWPDASPYPAIGAFLSARGPYEGEGQLRPQDLLVHPLRGVKIALGLLVSLLWCVLATGLAIRSERSLRATRARSRASAEPSRPRHG